MVEANIPADYAIDALSLEAERRSKLLGRPYSYGQLMADTTQAERETIAENYRKALQKAHRKGRYRVSHSETLMPERDFREVEDAVCQKLETMQDDMEKAGE